MSQVYCAVIRFWMYILCFLCNNSYNPHNNFLWLLSSFYRWVNRSGLSDKLHSQDSTPDLAGSGTYLLEITQIYSICQYTENKLKKIFSYPFNWKPHILTFLPGYMYLMLKAVLELWNHILEIKIILMVFTLNLYNTPFI